MSHTTKTFQAVHVYFTKIEETSRWIFTHIFFASANILIFGGLFYIGSSGYSSSIFNWIWVLTTDFAKQKYRTRRDNPNSSNPSWKARKKPPKGHTRNIPFFSAQFQRIGYTTCYIQEWDPN